MSSFVKILIKMDSCIEKIDTVFSYPKGKTKFIQFNKAMIDLITTYRFNNDSPSIGLFLQ